MPRAPRLDVPGALHHVIARGIERSDVFHDDTDRTDFLNRIRVLFPETGTTLYAWSLLSNHWHMLVRSGPAGISRTMRRLLGGYVTTFNRRHHRCGHLFQNRFKSTLVEEESYFLELLRYIHLNPLRAGIVPDLDALARYPWSGHAVLLGRRSFDAQDREFVLRQLGTTPGTARTAYLAFVEEGIRKTDLPDLEGGGLRRSAGGWETLSRITRGRERWAFDERVLGSSAFVQEILTREHDSSTHGAKPPDPAVIEDLCRELARRWNVGAAEIGSSSRRRDVVFARALVAFIAVRRYGFTQSAVAHALGVSKQTMCRGLALAECILPLVEPDIIDLLHDYLADPPSQRPPEQVGQARTLLRRSPA